MTSAIIPAASFALGAYAEKAGYIATALRTARDVHPTLRSSIDAMFGAETFATTAMGTKSAPMKIQEDDFAAGAMKAMEKALEYGREQLRGLREAAPATLGASRESATKVVEYVTTNAREASAEIVKRAPSKWMVFFAAGAMTGLVVAYAAGPEACAREARRAISRAKMIFARAREAMMTTVRAISTFEIPMEIKHAIAQSILSVRGTILGASKQLVPLLKSSSDNLLSLIDASKGTTTAYAGKVTEFVGDFREKYVEVAAVAVREKTMETYVAARQTTLAAYDKTKPVVAYYARAAREYISQLVDGVFKPQ